MVIFSLEQIPVGIALVVFVIALIIKHRTIQTRDIIAFVLISVLVFALVSGALMRFHVPNFAYHLF